MALITISRSLGSGGREIARNTARDLGLELYDDTRLQQEATRMQIGDVELESLDSKAPGFFDRIWSHKPELYQNIMQSVVYGVSRNGEGVILGHGSQFLLRDFGCALHVFVFASESTRVDRVKQLYGLSENGARKLIRKSDHEQRGYMKYAFHMDWDDPSLYDLLINTEKLGLEGAGRLISHALDSQTIMECGLSALETMESRALTKKIEAELLRQNLNLTNLQIESDTDGQVHISGFTLKMEDRETIENTVRRVPGVKEVDLELVMFPVDVC